ncbi:alcohol dehydrogenase catalytic domain-containing protein [Nocardiopsis baichengensis]|uniref:alcohol dehydrogenase catalytic domain-containing protein n=1 Tax=Nocardiopsis baichengensis TaxID=280240 RepID=UPI000345B959|nr:alcohol dehydrogenase catalytic domain-containing protein [Nocardiopsis baichengensis]
MTAMTMRAVQAVEAGGAFVPARVPVPEPGAGQVRVRVHACGVCAGEAIARHGLMGARHPRVPGHEIGGTVDAVGPGVSAWNPGDRVGVGWHGGQCSTCAACRTGDFANCAERLIVGADLDGGYAEYTVVPQSALARLPEALGFEEAAPLMCAGVTVFNALRKSGARPGDTVAVQGVGGLGHLAIQYADRMGFRVVAVSRGREKEEAARALGADDYIDASDAGGRGAGAALAAAGGARAVLATAGDAAAQADIAQGLQGNGTLLVAGTPHDPIPVSSLLLVTGRRSVQGCYSGHAKDSEEAMEFAVLTGIRPMVETYKLEEAEQAYGSMGTARFRGVLVP